MIHDLPHAAILLGGNDHHIEHNDIGRVVLESNDAGAIYTGRDWGYRGTVIRFNFIHHVESFFGGSHGVYLDDAVSGFTVTSNLLYQINGIALVSGGGRDNRFEYNLVVGAERSAHHSDRRARAAANNDWSGDFPDSWNLVGRLNVVFSGPGRGAAIDHQAAPWSTAYPAVAAIPDDWGSIADSHWLDPEGCVFARNLVDRSGGLMSEGSWGGDGAFDSYAEIAGNLEDVDPMFVDESGGDFALQPGSPAFDIPGFVDIPFDEIGPRP